MTLTTPIEIRCYSCGIADGTFHMCEEDCERACKLKEDTTDDTDASEES